jgi:hypothetical protein
MEEKKILEIESMEKVIRLTENDLRHIVESSVKKILTEFVGDEEALGRYDLSRNHYIPGEEKDSIINQKNHETEFNDNCEISDPEYIGQEINDPGPYADYKRYDFK